MEVVSCQLQLHERLCQFSAKVPRDHDLVEALHVFPVKWSHSPARVVPVRVVKISGSCGCPIPNVLELSVHLAEMFKAYLTKLTEPLAVPRPKRCPNTRHREASDRGKSHIVPGDILEPVHDVHLHHLVGLDRPHVSCQAARASPGGSPSRLLAAR